MNKIYSNYLLVLITLLFFFTSCSGVKPIHQRINNKNISYDSSEVDQNRIKIDESKTNRPIVNETVKIGNQGGVVFSEPQIDDTNFPEKSEIRKIKIGLAMGPGGYRTIAYVALLKKLERQGLAPDVVTGTGLGAIVAAMYANGMTPEVIEWNFYKYFKEKKKNKIHEKDWIEEVDKFFLQKFKKVNVQDTKKKLFLTLYDHNSKKTYFFDKGNIRDLLMMNLRLSNLAISEPGGKKYSTAFEKEIYNINLMKRYKVDFAIAADVLGTKFDFNSPNEFLFGVYGRAAGRSAQEKKSFDYAISLPLAQMNLDSTDNHPLFLQKADVYLQKEIINLQNKATDKRNELNDTGSEP